MTAHARGMQRNLDVDRLRRQHVEMARIRAFEEAAAAAVTEGTVRGFIHPYIGQEAIAVGVCANLTRDDLLLSTHRGHGHTLAKGASPVGMMCELLGRANGVCGGKGGSMHIADASVGMLGANGVVGANILIATGAAQAVKMQGQDRIVSCFFGDGAVNRGPFLEGLNWAAVFHLPVLFVCEDNAFSATTRTDSMTAGPGPAARAESLGVPAVDVDGNDVLAVDAAARELVAAIRAGGGPRLLVARTYRLSGHVSIDPAGYRSVDEVQARWEDDPIIRCADLLRHAGLDDAALAEDRDAAQREIAQAYQFAKESPWPDAREAFSDVQDLGAPGMEAS